MIGQRLDDAAADQVLLHDAVDARLVDAGVQGAFRPDLQHRRRSSSEAISSSLRPAATGREPRNRAIASRSWPR
jgi:hypothetical protein